MGALVYNYIVEDVVGAGSRDTSDADTEAGAGAVDVIIQAGRAAVSRADNHVRRAAERMGETDCDETAGRGAAAGADIDGAGGIRAADRGRTAAADGRTKSSSRHAAAGVDMLVKINVAA